MSGVAALKRKFIGDRAFYRSVLTIVVPIIVQNSISNFVNLIDNIMVGQVGFDQMNGVAIANQLMFVFSLCVFGGLSGAGIFGAQFYGAGDIKGLRDTFRFKLTTAVVLFTLGISVFLLFGDRLVSLYLTAEGGGNAEKTLYHAGRYMRVMLLGLPLFALSQCYGSTLREMGQTRLPMIAGIVAVVTNCLLNWALIFGVPGVVDPMGEVGAAAATVVSRVLELAIMVIGTHAHKAKYAFIVGAYKTLRVPGKLAASILRRGLPLLANECLWAMGMAMLTQTYSTRGLDVVAASNISSTVSNLFNVVFLSMGNALAVIVGQALGAGDARRARDSVWKLLFFSVSCCFVMGAMLVSVSGVIPAVFDKATDEARSLATLFIITGACLMPVNAITHGCYFTLRSGGRTFITFLFDCAYTWVLCVPFAALLVYGTALPMTVIFPLMTLPEIIKCSVGLILVSKGIWVRNLVGDAPAQSAAEGAT